jgi:disulfide bond formation protein DsbB
VTPDLSRLLNALGLTAIDTVLVLAFADQLWFRELPCPLCILSRAAFIAAGFGIALNLVLGPRPSHYGLTLLGASVGAAISIRQILLHIVPDTGSYGSAFFGLHLYSWALIMFGLMVVGTGIMLLFEGQFVTTEWHSRLRVLPVSAFMVFAALAVANVISTVAICGAGLCPKDPGGYLIFNDNLSLTLLGQPL